MSADVGVGFATRCVATPATRWPADPHVAPSLGRVSLSELSRSLKEQHQRSRYVGTTTAQFSGATPRSRLNWTRTLPRVAVFEQEGFDVRVGWGPRDAAVLAPAVDALVVVDVLRFTTAVDVAVARGVDVYPYPWRDGAAEYAAERGVE